MRNLCLTQLTAYLPSVQVAGWIPNRTSKHCTATVFMELSSTTSTSASSLLSRWTRPSSGLYSWISFEIDLSALLRLDLASGISSIEFEEWSKITISVSQKVTCHHLYCYSPWLRVDSSLAHFDPLHGSNRFIRVLRLLLLRDFREFDFFFLDDLLILHPLRHHRWSHNHPFFVENI